MKSTIIIKHPRFVIRQYRLNDAKDLVQYFGHPAVIRGIRGGVWTYKLLDAKKYIRQKIRQDQYHGKKIGYTIDIQGQLSGGVSANIDGRTGKIGYWLAKQHWNKGLMSAVIGAWTRYLFKTYKLKRIEAKVFPSNLASVRVLQKNRFRFEATLVQGHKIGRRNFDVMIFSKTK